MTNIEWAKCEKLMEEAIRNAENAKEEFDDVEAKDNIYEKYMLMGLAQNHMGYASGINQALVCIGFKHKRMKELGKLI